jgi:copper chaperone CopZ
MIVSTVSGRIRVRANRLKSNKIAEKILARAEQLEGVTGARVNPAAGSIVVSYDTRAVDADILEDQLEALCRPPKPANNGKKKTVGRYVNQATKVGMMTTLATSLAYGYLGNKKAHIRFGQAFVAFAGLHMLRHQSTLLR